MIMCYSRKKFFLLSALLLLGLMIFTVGTTPLPVIKHLKETIAVATVSLLLFSISSLLLINRLHKENQQLRDELNVSLSTDSQTGLLNSTSFEGMLEGEILRTVRYKMTFSLALFDLDGLQMINNFFGREGGDTAIIKTAHLLKTRIRDVDSFFYLHRGLYALILPNTNLSGAFILMSRLRRQLESTTFNFKGKELAITASFGVTEFDRKSDDSASIINRVENFVFKAKKNGRNRVC